MKYLILGAGPAGLAFAVRLKQLGEDSFLLLEKETEAGGLCRSSDVDEAPLDIGGGHFLDVRRPAVNQFLFEFMPKEEWNEFERDSRIHIHNRLIGHPMEAHIWQLDLAKQVLYLKSVACAGCNTGAGMPEKFVDWIYWKLGSEIARDYMIPYNIKMFSDDLNELGTYWLDKLPNVNFEEVLYSCLEKKPYGTEPGHARFYYPRNYGYGELWLRLAEELKPHIEYGKRADQLDMTGKRVITKDGGQYYADRIITTIPWKEWSSLCGLPKHTSDRIGRLKHTAIETRYFGERLATDAHWIYEPDPALAYHRILVRHNFSLNSRGYWTETRLDGTEGISRQEKTENRFINEYAYPLNTIEKENNMQELLKASEERGIYGLGRWGEHRHYNSDAVVELAISLAERLHTVR